MTTQEGFVKITREESRNIKKLDHKKMQDLLQAVYNAGEEAGVEKNDSRKLIKKALENVSGVGEKRKEQILTNVEMLCIERHRITKKV